MALLRRDGKLINALDSKTKLCQGFEVAVMDPSFVVKASPDCRRYIATSSFLFYRTSADLTSHRLFLSCLFPYFIPGPLRIFFFPLG